MSGLSDMALVGKAARKMLIKKWLLDPDSLLPENLPHDITFAEVNAILDELESWIRLLRRHYPYSKPANPTEAILRSIPPHLRDD